MTNSAGGTESSMYVTTLKLIVLAFDKQIKSNLGYQTERWVFSNVT